MGKKTACSREQWKQLTSRLGEDLSKEFRKRYGNLPGPERGAKWIQTYAKALSEASKLAVDDCDIDRIVNEVVKRVI